MKAIYNKIISFCLATLCTILMMVGSSYAQYLTLPLENSILGCSTANHEILVTNTDSEVTIDLTIVNTETSTNVVTDFEIAYDNNYHHPECDAAIQTEGLKTVVDNLIELVPNVLYELRFNINTSPPQQIIYMYHSCTAP